MEYFSVLVPVLSVCMCVLMIYVFLYQHLFLYFSFISCLAPPFLHSVPSSFPRLLLSLIFQGLFFASSFAFMHVFFVPGQWMLTVPLLAPISYFFHSLSSSYFLASLMTGDCDVYFLVCWACLFSYSFSLFIYLFINYKTD